MPELPEIETLKRTLSPRILGARVERVRVLRADVITRLGKNLEDHRPEACATSLLQGDTIIELRRHGKQLAIVGASGRVICLHLGMSGQVRVMEELAGTNHQPPAGRIDRRKLHRTPALSQRERGEVSKHVHVVWQLAGATTRSALGCQLSARRGALQRQRSTSAAESRKLTAESHHFWMIFRDPRRFGGIWTAPDLDTLFTQRWSELGPDALTITAPRLRAALGQSRRPIKAALLDQTILAGVGNIYADEALFRAAIHPNRAASGLSRDEVSHLARALRFVLRSSIRGGGSTLRDYADANGRAGRFAARHAVYGRTGQPCPRCELPLQGSVVAQRTTVFCEMCQPRNVHI